MNQKQIRQEVQKKIDGFRQYTVMPENAYCFYVFSDNNSITKTLIESVESMGYGFLHCQNRQNGNQNILVARFTYK